MHHTENLVHQLLHDPHGVRGDTHFEKLSVVLGYLLEQKFLNLFENQTGTDWVYSVSGILSTVHSSFIFLEYKPEKELNIF